MKLTGTSFTYLLSHWLAAPVNSNVTTTRIWSVQFITAPPTLTHHRRSGAACCRKEHPSSMPWAWDSQGRSVWPRPYAKPQDHVTWWRFSTAHRVALYLVPSFLSNFTPFTLKPRKKIHDTSFKAPSTPCCSSARDPGGSHTQGTRAIAQALTNHWAWGGQHLSLPEVPSHPPAGW